MSGTKPQKSNLKKIPEIEALRTLAISMVLAFHFFSRWAPPIYSKNIYPYEFEIPKHVSQYGYLGVQLFFMISGFVILRTLETRNNLKSFFIARLKRILPSLWLAILVIYLICNALNQNFLAPIPRSSIIPSSTLISPYILNHIFETNFIWTTGVLWSLLVEIQFYFLAAILFFSLKRINFPIKIFLIAAISEIAEIVSLFSNETNKFFDLVFPITNYIWWFVAGLIFYEISKNQKKIYLKIILGSSFLVNLSSVNIGAHGIRQQLITSVIVTTFYFLFSLIISNSRLVNFLRSKWLFWMGGLTYEFYLIHESIGVSILSWFSERYGNTFPSNLSILVLLAIIGILLSTSYLLKRLSQALLHLAERIK